MNKTIEINTVKQDLTINRTALRFTCSHESGWRIETNDGTEFVPADCVPTDTEFDREDSATLQELFGDYLEGRNPHFAEPVNEWQSTTIMPGCIDNYAMFSAESQVESIRLFLESENWDISGVPDYYVEAITELVELHNQTDDDSTRSEALEAICWNLPTKSVEFNPHNLTNCSELLTYSGDVNPIDHNGTFFELPSWQRWGYASTLNVCSAESKLWIEWGITNRSESNPETIADVYGIDKSEVNQFHEIDHNFSHCGAEIDHREEFDRLTDSGWFLDSDGELRPECHIEQIVIDAAKAMIESAKQDIAQ